MAVLHEAQQGSVQVGPQGILVLPSVQHRQKPSEEVQRRCWHLPACSLELHVCGEQQCMRARQRMSEVRKARGQIKATVHVVDKMQASFLFETRQIVCPVSFCTAVNSRPQRVYIGIITNSYFNGLIFATASVCTSCATGGRLRVTSSPTCAFSNGGTNEMTDLACRTAGWWWLPIQRARLALVGAPCMPPPPARKRKDYAFWR